MTDRIKPGDRVAYRAGTSKELHGTVTGYVDRGGQMDNRGHVPAMDRDWVYVRFDNPRPLSKGANYRRPNPFKVANLTRIETATE